LGENDMKLTKSILFAWLAFAVISQAVEPAFFFAGMTNGMAGVCLSNSTGRVIGFTGHSFGSKEPFYSIETKSADGWKGIGLGWCGTEAHSVSLRPSEFVIVRVSIPTNAPWRVGVRYWSGGVTNQVWSETIDLKPNHAVEPTRAPEGARGSP
jgi:hypothetical protein